MHQRQSLWLVEANKGTESEKAPERQNAKCLHRESVWVKVSGATAFLLLRLRCAVHLSYLQVPCLELSCKPQLVCRCSAIPSSGADCASETAHQQPARVRNRGIRKQSVSETGFGNWCGTGGGVLGHGNIHGLMHSAHKASRAQLRIHGPAMITWFDAV